MQGKESIFIEPQAFSGKKDPPNTVEYQPLNPT